MEDAHIAAAIAAHAKCFSDLPIANAYSLSANEALRRGLPKRSEEVDLTYGDVPIPAVANVLCAVSPRQGTIFYDLGSGVGRGVIAAALLHRFSHCVGIELLTDLHAATLEPARRFSELQGAPDRAGLDPSRIAMQVSFVNSISSTAILLRCELRQRQQQQQLSFRGGQLIAKADGHLRVLHWGSSLCRLASKLAEELPDGSKVITVGQRLPELVTSHRENAERIGAVRFEEVVAVPSRLSGARKFWLCNRIRGSGPRCASLAQSRWCGYTSPRQVTRERAHRCRRCMRRPRRADTIRDRGTGRDWTIRCSNAR